MCDTVCAPMLLSQCLSLFLSSYNNKEPTL
jgi:hypothetical protein